jgi:hypothetical protein
VKRHQQIVSKKNSTASGIRSRNQRTGQVTGSDKAARESDMENYALQTIGATDTLKELLGPRADDMRAKAKMYEAISREGFVSRKDLPSDPAGKVALNTVDTMFMGCGLRTDLVRTGLLLPITLDRPYPEDRKK